MTIITFEKLTVSSGEAFLLLKFPYDEDIINTIKEEFSHSETGYGYHRQGDEESPLYNECDEDCWFTEFTERSFEAIEEHLESPVPKEYWEEIHTENNESDDETETDTVEERESDSSNDETVEIPDRIKLTLSNENGTVKVTPFNDAVNTVITAETSVESDTENATNHASLVSSEIDNEFDLEANEFPVGLTHRLKNIFTEKEATTTIVDNRVLSDRVSTTWDFEPHLHPYQREVVSDVITHKNTIVQTPTGVDKAVVAARTIYELNLPTVIITSTVEKQQQWEACINNCLNEINWNENKENACTGVTVITYESVSETDEYVMGCLTNADVVVFDECQTPGLADELLKTSMITNATYRIGMTPLRLPDEHPTKSIVTAAIGEAQIGVTIETLQENGVVSEVDFTPETGEITKHVNGERGTIVITNGGTTNKYGLTSDGLTVKRIDELQPQQKFNTVILDVERTISIQEAQQILRMITPDGTESQIKDVNAEKSSNRTMQHGKMFDALTETKPDKTPMKENKNTENRTRTTAVSD